MLSVFGGRCPWCAGRADSQVQAWRRQSSPTVAAVEKSVEILHLQYFFVVDVPVVQVHLGVQSWTRSLTCLCCVTTGAWSSGASNCNSPQLHCVSLWEVPQMQFIACLVDTQTAQRQDVVAMCDQG